MIDGNVPFGGDLSISLLPDEAEDLFLCVEYGGGGILLWGGS